MSNHAAIIWALVSILLLSFVSLGGYLITKEYEYKMELLKTATSRVEGKK